MDGYTAGNCLREYIASLDNFPAEVAHQMAELRTKDEELQRARNSIYHTEKELADYLCTHRVPYSSQFEKALIEKTRQEFDTAMKIADQKIEVSNYTLELLKRHIQRLDEDINRFAEEAAEQQALAESRKENSYTGYIDTPRRTGLPGRPPRRGRKKATAFRPVDNVIVRKDDQMAHENWTNADDDDKVFCICQGALSESEMIACDDPGCPIEWYHLQCVGVKEIPSGNWFCDLCLQRRGQDAQER